LSCFFQGYGPCGKVPAQLYLEFYLEEEFLLGGIVPREVAEKREFLIDDFWCVLIGFKIGVAGCQKISRLTCFRIQKVFLKEVDAGVYQITVCDPFVGLANVPVERK